MKRIVFLSLLMLVALSSCRKVIDLKLKDSEPQFVLKGEVNAGELVHRLKITKSVAFDQSNTFPEVATAQVVLSDNLGNSETLTHVGGGVYETVNFSAVNGGEYTFTVTVEGKTFKATSTIPQLVTLLNLEFIPSNFFGDTGFIIVPKYQDPAGIKNAYLFNFYSLANPIENSGFVLANDDFSDGKLNEQPFFGSYSPQSGDTVVYTMWGIDQAVYTYYFSFQQNTSGNSGAPANPVSNWSNNALGYFSAQNKQVLVVPVP